MIAKWQENDDLMIVTVFEMFLNKIKSVKDGMHLAFYAWR